MRMQRCSISADFGYSAWSMKLRCRVVGDHPRGLWLHPGGHEGREVAHRQAVQHDLLADQAHRVLGGHSGLRKRVVWSGFEQEAIAERASLSLDLLARELGGLSPAL